MFFYQRGFSFNHCFLLLFYDTTLMFLLDDFSLYKSVYDSNLHVRYYSFFVFQEMLEHTMYNTHTHEYTLYAHILYLGLFGCLYVIMLAHVVFNMVRANTVSLFTYILEQNSKTVGKTHMKIFNKYMYDSIIQQRYLQLIRIELFKVPN